MAGLDVVTLAAAASLVGVLVAVGIATDRGGRIPGSFGSAFVGYSGDGWPRGVQEDDDRTWHVSAAPFAGRIIAAPPVDRRPTPPTSPERRR